MKKFLILTIFWCFIGNQSHFAQSFSDNFSSHNPNEFPNNWDLLQGSAQIESVDGKSVMKLGQNAIVTPFTHEEDNLSENFKIEIDLFFDEIKQSINYQYYNIRLWPGVSSGKLKTEEENYRFLPFKVHRHGIGTSFKGNKAGSNREFSNYPIELKDEGPVWKHLIIEYNQGLITLSLDGINVLNIPRYDFDPCHLSIEAKSSEAKGGQLRAVDNILIRGAMPMPDYDLANNPNTVGAMAMPDYTTQTESNNTNTESEETQGDINVATVHSPTDTSTQNSGSGISSNPYPDLSMTNHGIISEAERDAVQSNFPDPTNTGSITMTPPAAILPHFRDYPHRLLNLRDYQFTVTPEAVEIGVLFTDRVRQLPARTVVLVGYNEPNRGLQAELADLLDLQV